VIFSKVSKHKKASFYKQVKNQCRAVHCITVKLHAQIEIIPILNDSEIVVKTYSKTGVRFYLS